MESWGTALFVAVWLLLASTTSTTTAPSNRHRVHGPRMYKSGILSSVFRSYIGRRPIGSPVQNSQPSEMPEEEQSAATCGFDPPPVSRVLHGIVERLPRRVPWCAHDADGNETAHRLRLPLESLLRCRRPVWVVLGHLLALHSATRGRHNAHRTIQRRAHHGKSRHGKTRQVIDPARCNHW